MWRVENPTIEKTNLDFRSSGQGFREVSQLKSDEVVLMNALDLMDWSDDPTQIFVCGHCGYPRCEAGNWISLRLSGNYVFLMPAFDDWETDKTEYGPPEYLRKNGTPYFTLEKYKILVDLDLDFPVLENIRKLEMRDAMRIAQLEMPWRIFGEPPKVDLTKQKADLVIAASEGDHQEYLQVIDKLLRENYENKSHAFIRKPLPDEEIVSLFLDAAEFTRWHALSRKDGEYKLLVEESLVIEEFPI